MEIHRGEGENNGFVNRDGEWRWIAQEAAKEIAESISGSQA
jgi:hypothetical protein